MQHAWNTIILLIELGTQTSNKHMITNFREKYVMVSGSICFNDCVHCNELRGPTISNVLAS